MALRKREADGSQVVARQVREYLAALPVGVRRALKALHAIVRDAAPDAQPAFSYQIPAFAVDGRILVWCAGWKEHLSLHPVTPAMVRAGGPELEPFRHGKGTLRFPLTRPVPRALVRRIVRARLAELSARAGRGAP